MKAEITLNLVKSLFAILQQIESDEERLRISVSQICGEKISGTCPLTSLRNTAIEFIKIFLAPFESPQGVDWFIFENDVGRCGLEVNDTPIRSVEDYYNFIKEQNNGRDA